MQRSLLIWTAAVLGGMLGGCSIALAAPPSAGTFPITRAQVSEALRQDGLPSDPGHLQLAARVVASVARPHLQVVSLTAESAQLRLRLACMGRAECLPFFATVDTPSEAAALAAEQQWQKGSPEIKSVEHSTKVATVQNGSRLTMLLDGGHLHIKLPVICLSSGAPGETVRVAGLDRIQTYAAQVVDEHTVRGELP